jgi:hypothetical protein
MIEIKIKPLSLSSLFYKFFVLVDIDIKLTKSIQLLSFEITSYWIKFCILNLDLGYSNRINQLIGFRLSRSEPNSVDLSLSLLFFTLCKTIKVKHKELHANKFKSSN